MRHIFQRVISVEINDSLYPVSCQFIQQLNHWAFSYANIVAFVAKYGLDGVDFDWEYPGEPDIPGIPAGSAFDGIYYWEFVTLLKSALNNAAPDATVSIAAPASFWYLKAFPIEAISAAVDYIIFMTYDLHGQWDYGNANADIGCPAGNCLRSGVNLTETVNALSMITKAGVPSNKIVVGVTSYGRSFQMTEAGCYGPMCTYVGPSSGAYPGICTKTAGYLGNAEIAYMNATMSSTYSYLDDSYSNILVFDETQWVSYMDDDNKAVRASLYAAYNFAGTTDWAIDLQGTAQSLIDVCGEPTSSTSAPALCVSSEAVTCIAGTGDSGHKDLCNFTCDLGYCPSPCACTANGTANPLPVISAGTVYVCPAAGLGISYSSLCSFACKYGYCPSDYCTTSDSSLCIGLVLDQVNSTLSPDFLTNQSTCADLSTCEFTSIPQNSWASTDIRQTASLKKLGCGTKWMFLLNSRIGCPRMGHSTTRKTHSPCFSVRLSALLRLLEETARLSRQIANLSIASICKFGRTPGPDGSILLLNQSPT